MGLDSLRHLAAFPDGTGADHVPHEDEAGGLFPIGAG